MLRSYRLRHRYKFITPSKYLYLPSSRFYRHESHLRRNCRPVLFQNKRSLFTFLNYAERNPRENQRRLPNMPTVDRTCSTMVHVPSPRSTLQRIASFSRLILSSKFTPSRVVSRLRNRIRRQYFEEGDRKNYKIIAPAIIPVMLRL